MKRPKIVLILDKLIPAGTQRHVLQLVQELSEKIEFHVVSLEGLGEWDKELKKYPVVFHHYPLFRLYDLSGYRVYRDLIHLLKEIKPQGVETFMFTAHILGSFAARAAGRIPVISSRREKILWRKKSHFALRRWANRYCSLHLANSQAVAEDVKLMEGVEPSKVKHLANGLELPENPEPKIKLPAEKLNVVVLAALKNVKQHALLIELFAKIYAEDQTINLHFFGDGPLKDALQALALEKGVKEGIFFYGRVEEALNELPAFDFSILPSKSEGFSNSLLECLGSGLPSIAFDVDGNSEAIEHRETGILVEEGNGQKMIDAIKELAGDEALRKKMSVRARSSVREKYALKKMCDKKFGYYQEVFGC